MQQVEGIPPRGNDTVIGAFASGDDRETVGEVGGNRAAALALAGAGISVFPCQGWLAGDDAKTPCRGVRWRHESTTDKTRIVRWWATWPEAAPAIDVGKSNLLVIDCDAPKSEGQTHGDEWWRDRLEEQDSIAIPISNTPSGGRHYIFRQPDGEPIGNGRGSLPKKAEIGIDVRGAGGYIMAPGAALSGGREYVAEGSIADAPVAPEWLVDLLAPKSAPAAPDAPVTLPAAPMRAPSSDRARAWATAALDNEFREVASLPPGSRNEGLNLSAYKVGGLVGAGYLSHAEVFDLMRGAVAGWSDPIKTLGTLKRGLQDGARAPRIMPPEEGHNGAALAALIMSADGPPRLVEAASGDVVDHETGEVVAAAADEVSERLTLFGPIEAELDRGYLLPPGLVGEIATWILETSRRPLGRLAVGAALATVGTMIGRAVYGPTEAGCHLYVAGLARTGAGKDHPLRACPTLLRAGGMEHRVGPGEFTSQSAVVSAVTRRPAMLAPLDELGGFLARINHKKAGGWERGISKWLRTLWGSSLGDVQTPEYAGQESQTIRRPALSIFGVSTPEEFYGSLSDEDVRNGFVNRFVLAADERSPERDPPRMLSAGVPASIASGLSRLRELSEGVGGAVRDDPRLDGSAPIKVLKWGPHAKGLYDVLRSKIEGLEDRGSPSAALYARTTEMAVRIATIVAAGRFSDTVDVIDMISGATLAVQSANAMAEGLRDAGDGSEHGERIRRVSEIIRGAGTIKHRILWRKVYRTMEPRQFESVIRALIDAGEVEAEGFGTRGRGVAGAVYHWLGGGPGRARQVVTQVVTASAAA